ncbi:MAG: ATP-binding cassette domain-containing protein [Actinobacteria bacterium]|nr:MAG: ATP-binding cassette domain-containing protein [Actinomycetota bacterium]
MPLVLEAAGLTKQFRRGVLAVDQVDLHVAEGEVCGLLGPNGAGKTTLLRMVLGLVRPTAGGAVVLGTPVRPGYDALRDVGTLVEEPAFVPYLSGRRNLRLWWEAAGARWEDAHVDEALEVAGLGTAVDRRVRTYSHGMRQRLGLARALLGRPRLLVLDEPTNGLDPGEMREIRNLVVRLRERGVTVLLSSHLLAEVEQVCGHVVVLDHGRVVADSPVAEVLAASGSAYIEVDDRDAATRALATLDGVTDVVFEGDGLAVRLHEVARSDVVAALVAAGIRVETVTARHRLEDAFLELVRADP